MAEGVLMPKEGITVESCIIGEWKKNVGDPVSAGDVLFTYETDKAEFECESTAAGTLLAKFYEDGDEVPCLVNVCAIGNPGEDTSALKNAPAATAAPAAAAPAAAPAPVAAANGKRIRISPLARKTAAKMGVDYSGIAGTGPSGRIVVKDILAAAEAQKNAPAAAPAAAAAPAKKEAPKAGLELMEGDTVVKLTGMRKVVAERMLASHTEIPPVTQNIKVDVTELMKFRKMLLAETGKKYSVNDLVLKAIAKCLTQHPEILVSFDEANHQIIQRKHVNIGMAVALDAGLITPVIRDADKMGLDTLSATAKDLAARAKENKLTADEYKGSTITVSNLGMFGIETFTPIINQPDSVIVGVCAIEDELQMDDEGKLSKHQVMRLSVTLDHRTLDGAVVAKFEMDLRDILQNPMSIVL